MPLFRKDPTTTAPTTPGIGPERSAAPAPSAPSGGTTRIAPGTEVHGEIRGATEVVIEGRVVGDIELEAALFVAPQGAVEGDVFARSVRIAGKVTGNVRARDRVEILATGALEGDVAATQVILAEGAFFKGKVEMRSGVPKEPRAAVEAAAPGAATPAARQAVRPGG